MPGAACIRSNPSATALGARKWACPSRLARLRANVEAVTAQRGNDQVERDAGFHEVAEPVAARVVDRRVGLVSDRGR